MPTCSAWGCGATSSGKDKDIYKDRGFHSFPKDTFSIWEEKVKRDGWKATKHSVLCSKHFEEDCFEEDLYHKYVGRGPGKNPIKRLKKGAVPSLYLNKEDPPKPRTHTLERIKKKHQQEVSLCFQHYSYEYI